MLIPDPHEEVVTGDVIVKILLLLEKVPPL
jgi:hypothetical protein